jgi:hypothetical protein
MNFDLINDIKAKVLIMKDNCKKIKSKCYTIYKTKTISDIVQDSYHNIKPLFIIFLSYSIFLFSKLEIKCKTMINKYTPVQYQNNSNIYILKIWYISDTNPNTLNILHDNLVDYNDFDFKRFENIKNDLNIDKELYIYFKKNNEYGILVKSGNKLQKNDFTIDTQNSILKCKSIKYNINSPHSQICKTNDINLYLNVVSNHNRLYINDMFDSKQEKICKDIDELFIVSHDVKTISLTKNEFDIYLLKDIVNIPEISSNLSQHTQPDELLSTQTDELLSTQTEELLSTQTDELLSTQTEELLPTQTEELLPTQTDDRFPRNL